MSTQVLHERERLLTSLYRREYIAEVLRVAADIPDLYSVQPVSPCPEYLLLATWLESHGPIAMAMCNVVDGVFRPAMRLLQKQGLVSLVRQEWQHMRVGFAQSSRIAEVTEYPISKAHWVRLTIEPRDALDLYAAAVDEGRPEQFRAQYTVAIMPATERDAEPLTLYGSTVEAEYPFYELTDAGIEQAERLLPQQTRSLSGNGRQHEYSIAGQPSGNDTRADGRYLDDEEIKILKALRAKHPQLLSITDVAANAVVSNKTTGQRLSRLIKIGLVGRPKGPRGGSCLTTGGIAFVDEHYPRKCGR